MLTVFWKSGCNICFLSIKIRNRCRTPIGFLTFILQCLQRVKLFLQFGSFLLCREQLFLRDALGFPCLLHIRLFLRQFLDLSAKLLVFEVIEPALLLPRFRFVPPVMQFQHPRL